MWNHRKLLRTDVRRHLLILRGARRRFAEPDLPPVSARSSRMNHFSLTEVSLRIHKSEQYREKGSRGAEEEEPTQPRVSACVSPTV